MNPKWKMKSVLEESWVPSRELRNTFGIADGWLKDGQMNYLVVSYKDFQF